MTGPALDIATAVTAGRARAVDVAAAAVDRAEATQPRLNAFTSIDRAGALERAATIDRIVAGGGDPGPLAGVPVAVKDIIDQAGRITTCGSSFYRRVAATSATVVRRLEEAGAVIVGRTGLHEFAFGFSSENHWFGPVRNPWDTTTSPGGSSGGSGAAVAAGVVPLAIGTDTGGSVRVPAALCGTVGLKVTHGRVSLDGVFPLAASLDTVGPLATTVGDTALAYRVMAGDDPLDPWCAPLPVPDVAPGAPVGLRIGVPRPWLDTPTGRSVRDGFDWFLDRAAAGGAVIVELDDPLLAPPGEIAASAYFEIAGVHREWFSQHPDRYGPEVGARLARVFEITADDYLRALRWRAALRHAFSRAFARVDVIATPTVAAMRKTIGTEHVTIAGSEVGYRGPLSVFTALVNHAGLPALALPLARAEGHGGPAPGLQLIGPAWSEAVLLGFGTALESSGLVAYRSPPESSPMSPERS